MQTDGWIDMAELTAAFHDFVKAPENSYTDKTFLDFNNALSGRGGSSSTQNTDCMPL
jgi:hypothetical protein